MEILNNQKEMLEIKIIMIKVNNAFDEPISKLVKGKEEISESKDISTETSQTENQRE